MNMAEAKDFEAYVSLYDGLVNRFTLLEGLEDFDRESFEMNYLRSESGEWNAFIPSFIDNMQKQVPLPRSKIFIDMAFDNLVFMQRDFNGLSQSLPRLEHITPEIF